MFFIAYTIKGQVHVFAGLVKIVSDLSCRTSAIYVLKYFCPLLLSACTQFGFRPDQTNNGMFDLLWIQSVNLIDG